MFQFHGFMPVYKDCLHVTMCTNSTNSDYALMFTFLYRTLNCTQGEIQCPPPPFTICSECTRRSCFRPWCRKFSPSGRAVLRTSPQLSPVTSALPKTRIHHCLYFILSYDKGMKLKQKNKWCVVFARSRIDNSS